MALVVSVFAVALVLQVPIPTMDKSFRKLHDGWLGLGYTLWGSFRVSDRLSLVIRHKFQLRITPKI